MRGKLARPVREGADGKGPHPAAPRRRPTSLCGSPGVKSPRATRLLEHEDNEMMRPFVVTPLPMPRVVVSNAASHDTEVSPVVQALPKRSIL